MVWLMPSMLIFRLRCHNRRSNLPPQYDPNSFPTKVFYRLSYTFRFTVAMACNLWLSAALNCWFLISILRNQGNKLCRAAKKGDLSTVQFLLDRGVNVNAKSVVSSEYSNYFNLFVNCYPVLIIQMNIRWTALSCFFASFMIVVWFNRILFTYLSLHSARQHCTPLCRSVWTLKHSESSAR